MISFSVITPSFNMKEWLKLCVSSIADQQGLDVEHIICDGGSTDGTVDWLRELTGSDGSVNNGEKIERCGARTYTLKWMSGPDKGMYDAVNKGLQRARGDICSYLNCDEQYLPDALSGALEFLGRNKQVSIAVGDVVVTDPEGRYLFQREMLLPEIAHLCVSGMQVLTCGLFFRRAILDDEDMYFDSQWRDLGDIVWCMKALRKGLRFGLMRQFTSAFTETGSNMNLMENALREKQVFLSTVPPCIWRLRHMIVLRHRMKRLLAGHYRPKKHSYSIYAPGSPEKRTTHIVDRPSFRWSTREKGFWPSTWDC